MQDEELNGEEIIAMFESIYEAQLLMQKLNYEKRLINGLKAIKNYLWLYHDQMIDPKYVDQVLVFCVNHPGTKKLWKAWMDEIQHRAVENEIHATDKKNWLEYQLEVERKAKYLSEGEAHPFTMGKSRDRLVSSKG